MVKEKASSTEITYSQEQQKEHARREAAADKINAKNETPQDIPAGAKASSPEEVNPLQVATLDKSAKGRKRAGGRG